MLKATLNLVPDIFPFVHAAYSPPSHLHWGNRLILLAEGVQQGHPLGPFLFCLILHKYCQCLSSALSISYLDDVTIAGSCADILQDLAVVWEAEDIGLTLNSSKCKIITRHHTTFDTILTSLPGAHIVYPAHASLSGSPLGNGRRISRAIDEKIAALKRMGERLVTLSAHDVFILLRHSFSIPRLQYLLRTAPCYQSQALGEYDNTLRSILGDVTNTCTAVVSDDKAR